jgi:hypothetical protein
MNPFLQTISHQFFSGLKILDGSLAGSQLRHFVDFFSHKKHLGSQERHLYEPRAASKYLGSQLNGHFPVLLLKSVFSKVPFLQLVH